MSRIRGWSGIRGRGHGNCEAILQIAREVVENQRSIQGALNEVRHPAVIERLDEQDFEILDETIVESAEDFPEFALTLARLTHAAARAAGTDPEIVDAALRLDSLLPQDDPSRERDQLLKEAYGVAQRCGYAHGGRMTLARLGQRAADADDFTRARTVLLQQLEIGDESTDSPAEIDSAIMLGDILRREGDHSLAQSYYRRATRSAIRLEQYHGVAESLMRQIAMVDGSANLETMIAMQRQALEAAMHTSDPGLQSRIVGDLAASLARAGQIDEVIAQLEHGIELTRETGDTGSEGEYLLGLIEAYRKIGDPGGVAAYQDDLFHLEERSGNRQGAAKMAIALGASLLRLNKPNRAKEAYARAHQIAMSINNDALQQRAAGGLGVAYAETGHRSEALEFLMQARDLARQYGDSLGEAEWLANIGQVLWKFEQPAMAASALGESLAIARRLDDVALQAELLTLEGEIFAATNQLPRAREAYSRALELNRRLRRVPEQLALLASLGDIAMKLQHPAQTEQIYRQGLELASNVNNQAAMSRFHGRLGRLAQRQKNWSGAIDHDRLAVDFAEAVDNPALLSQTLLHLAVALHSIGDPGAAPTYKRALSSAELTHDLYRQALINLNLGLLLTANGHRDEGVDRLYMASDIAAELGSDADDLLGRIDEAISQVAPAGRPTAPLGDETPRTRGWLEMQRGSESNLLPRDQVYGESTLPPE